jgi:hypothetical protein
MNRTVNIADPAARYCFPGQRLRDCESGAAGPAARQTYRDSLPQALRKARIGIEPLTFEHAFAAGRLPGPHRDPWRRLMIGQAIAAGLTVVTIETSRAGGDRQGAGMPARAKAAIRTGLTALR